MRFIYLVLFSLMMAVSYGQNTPVMSKVTATWCSNCGSWGWGFMEDMKDEFVDGPGIVLGVHYSGDLANSTAEWWASTLNSSGQPKFYMNNDLLSVNRNNWSDEVSNVVSMADDIASAAADGRFEYDRILLDNDVLMVTVNVTAMPSGNGTINLANYVYENNVLYEQAGLSGMVNHPNVLRSTMGPDFSGMTITDVGTYEFRMDIPADWDQDELGVLTVIWSDEGNGPSINASQAVDMVSLISSSDDLLDESEFIFANEAHGIRISTENSEIYNLSLTDTQGRQLLNSKLNGQQVIQKSELSKGMYFVTIQGKEGTLSRQIFID